MLYKKGWSVHVTKDRTRNVEIVDCLRHYKKDTPNEFVYTGVITLKRGDNGIVQMTIWPTEDDCHDNDITFIGDLSEVFAVWFEPTEDERILFEAEYGVPYCDDFELLKKLKNEVNT